MNRVYTLAALSMTLLLASCGDDSADTEATFTLKGSASAAATAWYQPAIDALLSRAHAAPEGSPTSTTLSIYSVWLSPNTDCTSPVLVDDNGATPVEHDLFMAPDLISGSPADGVYNCMILEMDDTLMFQADATAVAAHAGCVDTTTEYTFDIYRDGESDDGQWIDTAEALIDATGTVAAPGTDKVAIFITTDEAALTALPNGPHENQMVMLTSTITVPTSVTLFWDFTDTVDENGGQCWLEGAEVGVR